MRTNHVAISKVSLLLCVLLSLSFACCNPDSTTVEITPWKKHMVTETFNAKDLFTGDIDGDGKEELVANDPMNKRMFSWFDHEIVGGEHQWTEHLIDDTYLPADCELQDLDGDGDLDLLMAGMCTAGEVTMSNETCLESLMFWYENIDRGTLWEKHIIGEMEAIGANYVASGDMDGDGDIDVAVTTSWMPVDPEHSEVAWFRNNINQGAPWDKITISPADASGIQFANGITISDLDRDGHPDVGVAVAKVMEEFGTVYWFKAPDTASGQWQRFQVDPGMATAAFSIFARDVNHDGYDDLVVGRNDSHRSENPGGIVFYINPRNPAAGGTWEQYAFEEGDYKMGPYINFDDINGDGKVDIINHYAWDLPGDPANVSWIEFSFNPVCGLVQERRVILDSGPHYFWEARTIDLYGDGKKALVVSAFNVPNIMCYEQP